MLDFLGRRPSAHAASTVGSLHDSHFDGLRFEVVSKLQDDVGAILGEANYDREAQAQGIHAAVQSSLAQFALLEMGAAAAGGLAAASLVDATGGSSPFNFFLILSFCFEFVLNQFQY